jgi:hypothetical protein
VPRGAPSRQFFMAYSPWIIVFLSAAVTVGLLCILTSGERTWWIWGFFLCALLWFSIYLWIAVLHPPLEHISPRVREALILSFSYGNYLIWDRYTRLRKRT